MKVTRNQQGIGHFAGLVVILVVLAIGVVGYRVVRSNSDSQISNNDSTLSSNSVPKAIKDTADVTKADKALDATSIDSSVNPNQLDSDLNALQ
jgi:uncharacterized protein HemX